MYMCTPSDTKSDEWQLWSEQQSSMQTTYLNSFASRDILFVLQTLRPVRSVHALFDAIRRNEFIMTE